MNEEVREMLLMLMRQYVENATQAVCLMLLTNATNMNQSSIRGPTSSHLHLTSVLKDTEAHVSPTQT